MGARAMGMDPDGREVEIQAGDHVLAGRFFAPTAPARAHLVLHGATGAPQRYYRKFAAWAASRGVGVLTYDYRDFGASLRGPTRASRATMADWGLGDQAAAEAALCALAPDGPIWILGHSLGGLTFAFRPHDSRVERVTTIGSGFTHVSDHPWRYLPLALTFWYLLGPAATAIAGYLPGRRLRFGADIPAGVYWQWRRWCLSRDFFRGDVGAILPEPDFGAPAFDLRMLTLSDDMVVPPAAVRRYADLFPQRSVDFGVLSPDAFGLGALGHIEVMSERSAAAWPAILGLDAPKEGRVQMPSAR